MLDCPICLEPLVESLACTPCGHAFHFSCLVQSLEYHKRCPKCKNPLQAGQTFPLYLDFPSDHLAAVAAAAAAPPDGAHPEPVERTSSNEACAAAEAEAKKLREDYRVLKRTAKKLQEELQQQRGSNARLEEQLRLEQEDRKTAEKMCVAAQESLTRTAEELGRTKAELREKTAELRIFKHYNSERFPTDMCDLLANPQESVKMQHEYIRWLKHNFRKLKHQNERLIQEQQELHLRLNRERTHRRCSVSDDQMDEPIALPKRSPKKAGERPAKRPREGPEGTVGRVGSWLTGFSKTSEEEDSPSPEPLEPLFPISSTELDGLYNQLQRPTPLRSSNGGTANAVSRNKSFIPTEAQRQGFVPPKRSTIPSNPATSLRLKPSGATATQTRISRFMPAQANGSPTAPVLL